MNNYVNYHRDNLCKNFKLEDSFLKDFSIMGAEMSNQIQTRNDTHDLAGNLTCHDSCHIQTADWEKAALQTGDQTKSQLIRMHFSDYSLFPDRFEELKGQRRGSLSSDTPSSIPDHPISPSSAQGVQISKYSFRIRTPSSSDNLSVSLPGGSIDYNRPRSGSYGNSKLYYFDFSLIPDKDPNCTLDENKTLAEPRTRRRLYSAGDLAPHKEEDFLPPSHPVIKVNDKDTIKEEEENVKRVIPPRQRKSSAPTRFCFFDYSMIPDKDPRWTPRPKEKPSEVSKTG